MPCDTVRRTPVRFNKIKHQAASLPMLAGALQDRGFTVRITGANALEFRDRSTGVPATYYAGEFNVPATLRGWDLDRVKEAYAARIVAEGAKRFGWLLTKKSDTEFEDIRRTE